MNNVNLAGRLTKDSETRDTGNKKITELRLATDRARVRDGKVVKDAQNRTVYDTEFHRITVFGALGVAVREQKKKGDPLGIRGWLHYSKWTDQNQVERYGVEIIAEEIHFL